MKWACIAAVLVSSVPGLASAATVVVPFSATFVAQGTIADGIDQLDLFGGGDLTGLPYTDTYTIDFVGIPYKVLDGGYYTSLQGPGTVTTTINGHSFTIDFEGFAGNFANPGYDRRGVAIDEEGQSGPYDLLRAFDGVDRSPSQWATDPAGANIFQDNTVYGSGTGVFLAYTPTTKTALDLDITSITSTYTTTTVSIPEPRAWSLMLVGLGGLGLMMRKNRRNQPIAA